MTNEDKCKLETAVRTVIDMLKDNKYNGTDYTPEQILNVWDNLRGNTWFTYQQEV